MSLHPIVKKGKYNLNEIFKQPGSKFTKYGRTGNPHLRLVYLNDDETEILWKDPNSNEKPRKLLIKDAECVIIGNEHTQVMRKQKVPAHLDNHCISVICKNRTLDLMHSNPEITKLWQSKIWKLINKAPHQKGKLVPDSPMRVDEQSEFHIRDRLDPLVEKIWEKEVLNKWSDYWKVQQRDINFEKKIPFSSHFMQQAIIKLMEQ